jgi:uncharacterized LabA/DUF88 family protein
MSTVERVYVAIDVNNLWHSCRDLFGKRARVNYTLLKELIDKHHAISPHTLNIVAYVISLPDAGNAKFIESLNSLGFTVKIKQARLEKGISKMFATDWDVGIAIDAIDDQDTYDTFVLVSGDGDYGPLLERLHKQNKRTEVVTFKKTCSSVLYGVADELIFLGDNEVFHVG